RPADAPSIRRSPAPTQAETASRALVIHGEDSDGDDDGRYGGVRGSSSAFLRISSAAAPKYFTTSRPQVGVLRTFAMYSSRARRSRGASLRTPKARLWRGPTKTPICRSGSARCTTSASSSPSTHAVKRFSFSPAGRPPEGKEPPRLAV